jgi:hypothetical protein
LLRAVSRICFFAANLICGGDRCAGAALDYADHSDHVAKFERESPNGLVTVPSSEFS